MLALGSVSEPLSDTGPGVMIRSQELLMSPRGMRGPSLGAVLGAWTLTQIDTAWLQVLVALFLVSTVWQYRLGRRERSFRMPLPAFVPVTFVVGLVSAVVGASGIIALPFYLNYGLV